MINYELQIKVIDTCLYKGSRDNMSIIIIAFPSAPKVLINILGYISKKINPSAPKVIKSCCLYLFYS